MIRGYIYIISSGRRHGALGRAVPPDDCPVPSRTTQQSGRQISMPFLYGWDVRLATYALYILVEIRIMMRINQCFSIAVYGPKSSYKLTRPCMAGVLLFPTDAGFGPCLTQTWLREALLALTTLLRHFLLSSDALLWMSLQNIIRPICNGFCCTLNTKLVIRPAVGFGTAFRTSTSSG